MNKIESPNRANPWLSRMKFRLIKTVGSCALAAVMACSVLAPGLAYADTDPQALDPIPSGAVSVGNLMTTAAYRAAGPAPEILGLAGVEESGQFVTVGDWYNWTQPKYYLDASFYNGTLSPWLANLAVAGSGYQYSASLNVNRTGGGAGPAAALGTSDAENGIWAKKPMVVVGTGDLKGSGPMDYYASQATTDYKPAGAPYVFSTLSELCDTMDGIAQAAQAAWDANGSKAGINRFNGGGVGSAQAIANSYRKYTEGTLGYVAKYNKDNLKRVALVQNATQDDDGTWWYDLMTRSEATSDGTASINRYLEATCYNDIAVVAVNIADEAKTPNRISAEELAELGYDLLMVGGQNSSANFDAIIEGLNHDVNLRDTYFLNGNNATAGAMYGVVMNSVENAQNLGRILGMLYPDDVDQQSWLAYYYRHFYHITETNLVTVMNSALDGVRNADAVKQENESPALLCQWNIEGESAWEGHMSDQDVADALDEGMEYLASQQNAE